MTYGPPYDEITLERMRAAMAEYGLKLVPIGRGRFQVRTIDGNQRKVQPKGNRRPVSSWTLPEFDQGVLATPGAIEGLTVAKVRDKS